MIRIVRTRDPQAVSYMVPHFTLPGTEADIEMMSRQLMHRMVSSPEAINVIQIWDGEDLIAFIIGIASENPFIWIAQAWSKSGNQYRITSEMYERILLWAMALGKDSVRAETSRDLDSMNRRFGFEPVATIIERKITQEEVSAVLGRTKELVNG